VRDSWNEKFLSKGWHVAVEEPTHHFPYDR
jgi:hypothetical protein